MKNDKKMAVVSCIALLSMCAFGGMVVYPTPAMAIVAQSPTIKVRGQVIDEQGEPMPGATVKIKGGPIWTETFNWRFPETLSF